MPKVLVAEDDRTMMSLLKTLLKMEGFDVVTLDVNADVPAAVQNEAPDVLLVDVHLGKQSGMDIVKGIRRNPEFANVEIIMTSGLNVEEECLKCGADHFLLKPFMPDELIKLLKEE